MNFKSRRMACVGELIGCAARRPRGGRGEAPRARGPRASRARAVNTASGVLVCAPRAGAPGRRADPAGAAAPCRSRRGSTGPSWPGLPARCPPLEARVCLYTGRPAGVQVSKRTLGHSSESRSLFRVQGVSVRSIGFECPEPERIRVGEANSGVRGADPRSPARPRRRRRLACQYAPSASTSPHPHTPGPARPPPLPQPTTSSPRPRPVPQGFRPAGHIQPRVPSR